MLSEILGINISNVHFNSKLIQQNGLFVPIKGEKQDGHLFLEDAINNGAVATLWDKKNEIPETFKNNIKYILVDDTLKYFQELAHLYRKEIDPIVIGITGSNGKTTTKEFVYAALSEDYKVHKTSGNFNNHLGVPLTLLTMPKNTQICIVEMGMNHSGEISVLTKMAQPNYAIITNIGESHIGQLGTRENIANAKMEILEGLIKEDNCIYDGDEPLLNHLSGYPITDSNLKNKKQLNSSTSFVMDGMTYELPTLGLHNIKNAVFAIKVANLLKVKPKDIQKGLMNFKNQSMRLEYKEINCNSFLLDCYNSSLTSLKSAIETFLSINTNKVKIAILGDIFELGNESESTHKQVGEFISNRQEIEYWFVGNDMKYAYDEAGKNIKVKYFPNKSELLIHLNNNKSLIKNHYFLLKASRGMELEDILEHFNNYR